MIMNLGFARKKKPVTGQILFIVHGAYSNEYIKNKLSPVFLFYNVKSGSKIQNEINKTGVRIY